MTLTDIQSLAAAKFGSAASMRPVTRRRNDWCGDLEPVTWLWLFIGNEVVGRQRTPDELLAMIE